MKKLYCVICRKYRKFEKPKISYLLEKIVLSIICSTEANRGHLKCSIQGTNYQWPKIFNKFIQLHLFNIKHKIVHLQVV